MLKADDKYKLKYVEQNHTQGLSYIIQGGNNIDLWMDIGRKFYIFSLQLLKESNSYILYVNSQLPWNLCKQQNHEIL